MWWQRVINYPHKSIDNFHNQALEFRWAAMGWPTNRLRVTLTLPLQICNNFQIHAKKIQSFCILLKICFSSQEKISPHYYSS